MLHIFGMGKIKFEMVKNGHGLEEKEVVKVRQKLCVKGMQYCSDGHGIFKNQFYKTKSISFEPCLVSSIRIIASLVSIQI